MGGGLGGCATYRGGRLGGRDAGFAINRGIGSMAISVSGGEEGHDGAEVGGDHEEEEGGGGGGEEEGAPPLGAVAGAL
eukprot:c17982_g1_i1 orf=3-233(-)